ncbi:hypothetical protein I350_03333 [Cryptococcus amylolentus CBS 6273]|uniref:Uncharacterized protein n=1 Tax=Cryptococcus amylolentus CBS 6273 TaxID=1296118 RepID=A0A1E3K3T8_9TREE|nr:hypothetical protein I350_03333 [Cryptococcus amylolentus CBS 6273]
MTPHWQTVSPQTRPLTLTVLDLTPLALTVSLSLTPSASLPLQPSTHHAHGVHGGHPSQSSGNSKRKRNRRKANGSALSAAVQGEGSEDDEHEVEDSDGGVSFKDLLRHGVLVYVNGVQSNNLFANVMDDEDDDEWEDDPESVPPASSEELEENMEQGVTRRRPRKARFGASAAEAAGKPPGKKKDEKHHKGDKDRAVLVIYGLMPGKEYEVELRVVGMGGQEADPTPSTSVLIPASPGQANSLHPRSRANSLRSRSRPRSRSNSLTTPQSEPTPAESTPAPATEAVIPTPILNPIDTQAAQLRHAIATLHTEKDVLQTQIKEARRTAQRQEAALKQEIEGAKKGIDKAGGMDLRAKQKALALQEQVKQGWAGAESAEKEAGEVESSLGDLEKRLEELKAEVDQVEREWKGAKDEEDRVKEDDKKTRAEEDKKLQEVVTKIEKLRTKKAKREAEGADLEKRIEELEKECEEVERKNEDEKASRSRTMSYYAAGYGQNQPHHDDAPAFGPVGAPASRGITQHPSLSNLAGGYAAGPAYRPRAVPGYTPRFPSGGARPSPNLPSPTHGGNSFYPISHPVPPSASASSPSFRAPKVGPVASRPGVNASALPFHPATIAANAANAAANASPVSSPGAAAPSPAAQEHTTSLLPPGLQHRIYLPNNPSRPGSVRPFQPSPLHAERPGTPVSATKVPGLPSSPTSADSGAEGESSPAFPPLPGSGSKSSPPPPAGGSQKGPSLASIVTRAVLSPTSALVQPGQPSQTPPQSQGSTPQSQVQGQARPSPPSGMLGQHPHPGMIKRQSYTGEFPALSPKWGAPVPAPGAVGGTTSRGPSPPGAHLNGNTNGSGSNSGNGSTGAGSPVGLSMKEGMSPAPSASPGGAIWGGNQGGSVSGLIMKKREDQA